jgi:two-component system sensor kinase FixL
MPPASDDSASTGGSQPALETKRLQPPINAAMPKPRGASDATAADEPFERMVYAVDSYAIYTLDRAGIITSWNAGAERILGYGADEIVGAPFSRLYVAEDVADGAPRRHLEAALGRGALEMESQRLRKNGERFWALVDVIAVGQPAGSSGFLVISRDITQRKHVEARARQMTELALNAMVLVNRNGEILEVNPQTEKMFGYSMEELIGQPVELLTPVDIVSQHRAYRDAFFARPAVRAMGAGRDLKGRRKDGSHFPVEIGLNPFQSEEGLLVLASIVDITERKVAEDRARLHVAEVAHAGRLSTVGEMFSGLAHEVNQPLAAAANYVRAGLRLARSPQGATQTQLLEWFDKAGGQVARAIEIVKRVGKFVKKERSAQQVLQLERVIENVVGMPVLGVGLNDGASDVVTRVTCDPALPDVLADRVQIEQVLLNLVRNAIESMHDVPLEQRQLTIDAQTSGPFVQVAVRDTGHGITPENMTRLFSPFFTTKADGMGLGLSISRSIIEAHSGRLWAESEPGVGTSFFFTLPVIKKDPRT